MHSELQRAITLRELAPCPFYSNTNVHLVDINMFANVDEIPSLPVQDIMEKPKCCGQLQRAITLTELAPSPYFSITNVHHVHINAFAKFDEIPSLPVQVIKEKPKRRRLRITRGNNSKRIGPLPLFFYYKCSSYGYQYVCQIL